LVLSNGLLELATEAVLDDAVLPRREALALSGVASQPGRAIRQASDTVRAFAKLAPGRVAGHGILVERPIGKERRFTWAQASLE
jgi:hypothetical protein